MSEMRDTIERQEAINALGSRPGVSIPSDYYGLGARNQYDKDRLALETLPPAEPKAQDVVDLDFNAKELKKAIDHVAELLRREQGEWIERESLGVKYIECGNCWCWFLAEHMPRRSFCPNCGADMRGGLHETN